MEAPSYKKRLRVDSVESTGLAQHELVKRLRANLFADDIDLCERDHDIDSFIKSFEKEIAGQSPATRKFGESANVSGESQVGLGYLLEATDDELGLPPSRSSVAERQEEAELVRVVSDSVGLGELWGHEGYDSFDDFGFGDSVFLNTNISNFNGENVVVDGLFDDADIGFESSDFIWQP